jgi:hypothetical protein
MSRARTSGSSTGATSAPTRPPVPRTVLLAVVAIAVALAACFVVLRPDGSDDSGGASASAAADTQDGLCATLDATSDGDVVAARRIFYDRSHDGLHALAARAFQVDTTAAARLLEAKYPVEALLEGDPTPAQLTSALGDLADATAAAARALGEPGVERCG